MKKKLISILAIVFLCANATLAQRENNIGLSASLQRADYGIQVPVWISEKAQMAPGVGFTYAEDEGMDLRLGLNIRFYTKTEGLAPYIGLMAGAAFLLPDESDDPMVEYTNQTDFFTGLAFGGEYFIDESFSIGVEAQGNLSISDEGSWRFGNPGGVNFNLGTAIRASVYF